MRGRLIRMRGLPRFRTQVEVPERPGASPLVERAIMEATRDKEIPRVLREAARVGAGQREAAVAALTGRATVDSWVWATLPPERPPVVGGPQRCWRAWEEIGASPMWLSILREGLWAPVDSGYDVSAVPWGGTLAKSREEKRWMLQESLRLIATGAMVWCDASELLYCSGTFLAPKTGPKLYRQIVNMKPVNFGWVGQRMSHRMEGLKGFLQLVTPGAWMLSWDLAEAYFHLMLHPETSRYFGVEVTPGRYAKYLVCTFGWVQSMYYVNKLFAIFKRHLRRQYRIGVWSHVDDFAAAFPSLREAIRARDKVVGPVMQRLGMSREKDKGQWDQPAQETTIYGFLVNTVGPYGRGLVTIPQAKVEDLQLVLAAMQEAEGTSVPDRFLAKVGGKLISVREAFSPAKLWSAEFFWALDMPNKLWWGAKVLVSSEMAESARFLQTALNLFNGMPIWMPHASILFRWDASGVVGWGAAVWTHPEDTEPAARAGGYWESDMISHHINDKEAQACLLGMLALRPYLQDQTVLPQGDSRTANADVREFRGSMLSPFRTNVVRQIWLLAIEMGVSLLPVEYVNTLDNDVADLESRELDPDDWAISDCAWAQIETAFGPHDWDRFASMENRRCRRYTAKRYQPECHWPQALSQPWEGRNNYCCPPESMLLEVLQLLRASIAEATVIAPTYQGNWWPLLQELCTARLDLPPVDISFQPGRSGRVEPWRLLGAQQLRQYAAFRVRGLSS